MPRYEYAIQERHHGEWLMVRSGLTSLREARQGMHEARLGYPSRWARNLRLVRRPIMKWQPLAGAPEEVQGE